MIKPRRMTIEALDRLARTGEATKDATAIRLRAAIHAAGMTPTIFARRSGQQPNAVFNSLGARSFPSIPSLHTLYRSHRIDPAFVLFGDYRHLPTDVQDGIFSALEAAASARDQSEDSD